MRPPGGNGAGMARNRNRRPRRRQNRQPGWLRPTIASLLTTLLGGLILYSVTMEKPVNLSTAQDFLSTYWQTAPREPDRTFPLSHPDFTPRQTLDEHRAFVQQFTRIEVDRVRPEGRLNDFFARLRLSRSDSANATPTTLNVVHELTCVGYERFFPLVPCDVANVRIRETYYLDVASAS